MDLSNRVQNLAASDTFAMMQKVAELPASFCQKRVGNSQAGLALRLPWRWFRSMVVSHSGSSVSAAGDSRITPFGAKFRHFKQDELPELWDVFIGKMSLTFGFPPPCKT